MQKCWFWQSTWYILDQIAIFSRVRIALLWYFTTNDSAGVTQLHSRMCFSCNWVTPASSCSLSNTTMPYIVCSRHRVTCDDSPMRHSWKSLEKDLTCDEKITASHESFYIYIYIFAFTYSFQCQYAKTQGKNCNILHAKLHPSWWIAANRKWERSGFTLA